MDEPLVTVFCRHHGRVLSTREDGRWTTPSTRPQDGESPAAAALRAVHDRLGVDATVVRTGQTERDGETVRSVLLSVDDDAATTALVPGETGDGGDGERPGDSERGGEWEWVHPTELRRRETVPGLWRAYERVAPTLRSVVADDDHGSTWLSLRALEVLRDRAGLLGGPGESEGGGGAADWDELADLADRLRTARPGMAAVRNRVDRAMAAAADERSAAAVEAAAVEGIERAVAADGAAAAAAADRIEGQTVLTLSRSRTVLRALRTGAPAAVFVAESRPAREGVGVAETLSREGERVTLHTDAAVGSVVADRADVVLVGADAVRPDGTVVNKTGTRTAAAAAANEGVPVYAVTASDKVTTAPVRVESGPGGDLYDGDAPLDTYDPLFDETPPSLVDGVVTERGVLSTDDVEAVATELAALSAWDDPDDADEADARERGD